MKEDHQKTLKRVTLFFLLNPVPFNRQNYQKQKGPGTSDHLLFKLRNKIRKIPLLVMYYRTKFDDVKIKSLNLCKPIDDIINYFTFISTFKSRKCGKEGKKLHKI